MTAELQTAVSAATARLANAVKNVDAKHTAPTSPVFVYNPDETLNTITYSDGTVKTFSYANGKLAQLDTVRSGVTTRKTFNYTGGKLSSISEAVI